MKVLKLYGASWIVIAAMVLMLYQFGSLTSEAILIVGFAASVLTGAGLLVVYPVLLHEEGPRFEERTLYGGQHIAFLDELARLEAHLLDMPGNTRTHLHGFNRFGPADKLLPLDDLALGHRRNRHFRSRHLRRRLGGMPATSDQGEARNNEG